MSRSVVVDVVLLLDEVQRTELAAMPDLLLVVQLDVSEEIPLPLEDLVAVCALQLCSLAVGDGHVLLEAPLLGEELPAEGAGGVDLHVEGGVLLQQLPRGE